MRGWNFGLAHGFLQRYRVVRSSGWSRPRLRKHEQEIASFLEHEAGLHERADFDHFLEAQGYRLKRYDSYNMVGIPKDQFVFLMLKDANGALTPWASAEEAVERVRMKMGQKPEIKDKARVWLCFLWFSLLHLQYPKIGRGFTEVSRYQEAVFEKNHLAEVVNESLTKERNEPVESPSVARAYLLETKSPKINSRIIAFIAYLVEINHLIEVEPGVYQQTLLASSEIGVNFDDGLGLMAVLEDEEDGLLQQTESAFEMADRGETAYEQEF